MGVFQHDGKGDSIPFSPIVQTRREAPDADYPLTALLGSLRYHLGSGTRTSYSSRIRDFGLKGEVEISPEDAQELGLQDGDTIRLSSKNGVLEREIRVDQGLGRGMIFVPVGFNGNDAMQLISSAASEGEQIEGIKICRVTMEKM
ncbi:MAG: hypothetical protein GY849_12580 [Deltaproteobacteria bacterium]|nr:hypothetical protein [Deltaproteobacteria bacterium]